MGEAFSKVGINVQSGGKTPKATDHEFQYRYTNVKSLLTGLKNLVKSISDTNTSLMNTPARMMEVGEGFMAISACMNHAGAGGASQSSAKRAAENQVGADEGGDLSPQFNTTGGGSTKINRALAKKTYESAQAFTESMRRLKEVNYTAYRTSVETQVIRRAEALIAQADATRKAGDEAAQAAKKSAAAQQKVNNIESKCAKKGTATSTNKNYTPCVTRRDELSKITTLKKDAFHESYEALMGNTQEFSVRCMDQYLDLTAAFNRECVRATGPAGVSAMNRATAATESHEPMPR